MVVSENNHSELVDIAICFQFGNHLLGRFGSGFPPEQCRDVAEVAHVGTTSGILYDRVGVFFQIGQFPQGNRGCVDIGHLRCTVDSLGAAFFQVVEKPRQC